MEHKYTLATGDILWLQNFSHKTTHGQNDILSLNNGVAISGCLQSATSAIFEMLRSIKISLCPTSWGRMLSYKNRKLQDGLKMVLPILVQAPDQIF